MILLLSGKDWFIHENEDLQLPPTAWIPATVPGNIQTDLEAAHRLKPLSYGMGDERLYDVATQDWWYHKTFDVEQSVAGDRATLVFEGVDHECEVWLNERRLGSNAGMYRRLIFDVAETLRPGESNHLAVKISGMPADLKHILSASDGVQSGGGPNYPDTWGQDFFLNGINQTRQTLKDLKSPANFGWDWGFNVYTLGIWRDVYLRFSDTVRVDWLQVETTLSDNYQTANLTIQAELDSTTAINATVTCTLRHQSAEQQTEQSVDLSSGMNTVTVAMSVPDPALWFPNGYGAQPLYELQVVLRDRDGHLLDSCSTRVGIREISWSQVEGAPADFINPYQLSVNGVPLRMMGSNLIPPDLFFGRMNDKGLRLIRLAHRAGMNTLRIWGGGALLTDAMYDLADELGIMLSQEFPLANCVPEEDPVFLDNFTQTITHIIKRLRNHPCIIEWSGGNEMNWKQGKDYPALKCLEELSGKLDNRILRATCPMQGSRHSPWHYDPETHYQHYDNPALRDNLNSAPLMRYGEFGCQTPANLEVWLREIPPSDRHDLDNLRNPVLVRKNVVEAVFAPHFWLLKPTIEALFGPVEDLAMLVEAGQYLGAEGVRYAVDATRRRGKRVGGMTTWDLNEPWSNGAGSFLIDYDGRPLMNYDFIKQAFAPVALSLRYSSILYDPEDGLVVDLWATSDAPQQPENLRWRWQARNSQGLILASAEGLIKLEAGEVTQVSSQCIAHCSGIVIVEIQLLDEHGARLNERAYSFGDRSQPAPLKALLNGLRRTRLEAVVNSSRCYEDAEVLELELINHGSMTAMFCEVHPHLTYRNDIYFSQNHVCIPPQESRFVTIKSPAASESGLSLAQTGWFVSCWNADDCRIPPHESILLAVGRRDATTGGYSDAISAEQITVKGAFPNTMAVPALLGRGTRQLRFEFPADDASAGRAARLLIHSADQDAVRAPNVEVSVNDSRFSADFPCGLGIQNQDRFHLAFPASLQFDVPPGILRAGENAIEISVTNDTWFSWDSLQLLSLSDSF